MHLLRERLASIYTQDPLLSESYIPLTRWQDEKAFRRHVSRKTNLHVHYVHDLNF